MLYVYKQSEKPLQPWTMLRTGGPNNIASQAKGQFLVLQNAEALHRDGAWHYILEFDVRDSLALSPLAQMMGRKDQPASYPDGTNWRKWLGDNWQVIDEHARWEMLHLHEIDPTVGEDVISDVRELPEWAPQPQPQKRLNLFPTPAASPAPLPLPEDFFGIPPLVGLSSGNGNANLNPIAKANPNGNTKPKGNGKAAPPKAPPMSFDIPVENLPQPVA